MAQKNAAKTTIQDILILISQYLPQQEGHQPDIRSLVPQQKINEAFIIWALLRMGVDVFNYIEKTMEAFLIDLVNHTIANGGDVAKAAQESKFFIPSQLGGEENLLPFQFREKAGSIYPSILGVLDLNEALHQYNALLHSLRGFRNKRFRNRAAQKMALQEALPKGISNKELEEYLSMKRSDIACSVLLYKYNLKIKREALKKYLALARRPAASQIRS